MSREVIHLRGSGGAVWEMTLPLHEQIAKRYEAGELTRVNADGSPWAEPGEAPAPRKPRSRAKAAEADGGSAG